jgi:DNA ligase-1
MLCERLTDPARLSDRRYLAEPKLDGQRAQLHVVRRSAVACYSRRGEDLLQHAGMAWLRDITWPFDSAILDGEACAGDGLEGIHAVFSERRRPDGAMSLFFFDLLALDAQIVMREPWRDRRKRLEDVLERARRPRVGIVPVADDAAQLYEMWVGMGGEGVVLKQPDAPYRPGARSSAWLKLKPKLTLDAVVIGGSAERIAWGHWGEAVMLELRYEHPRTHSPVEIRQASRIPRTLAFDLRIEASVELVCRGVMPSGLLRHPLFLGWR